MTASAVPTLSAYVSQYREWFEKDRLIDKMRSDSRLEIVTIMGHTQLGFAEARDTSAVTGTLAFQAAASECDNGVHFTHGLQFHESYFSKTDQTLQGCVRFLPSAASGDGTVSSGAVAAVMDEVLGDIAWCANCSGFTASLTVDLVPDTSSGANRPLFVATTFAYIAHVQRSELTARGASKCYVTGSLTSADGATIYARASAVFVRPVGMPDPTELQAMYGDGQEKAIAKIVANAFIQDPDLQRQRELRRAAALDKIRDGFGGSGLLTHVLRFEQVHGHWLAAQAFVSSLGPGFSLVAPEFEGKVLTYFADHQFDQPLIGAVHFTFCAQGPPSTAHGGSRFAVLQHAALQACQAQLGVAERVRLETCTIHLRAQLPLDTTVRLEIDVPKLEAISTLGFSSNARRLKLSGRMTDVAQTTVYDTVEAVASIYSQELLHEGSAHHQSSNDVRSVPIVASASKL